MNNTMYTAIPLEKKSVLKVMFIQKEKPTQECSCGHPAWPPSLSPQPCHREAWSVRTTVRGGDKVSLCDQTQVL